MNHAALTARYRPQTFADVAGQSTLKAILSRASAEDKVAPAYLFSGTRGVGKTTIARVFAKALNCRKAPAVEPCNECEHCRSITMGSFVDVVEIDGASNRGIDDVRRLKESVGYAPMEGRYKIFIIDEAHMLSREAFNALLKTLEEPPARVTFIMATTEPHKFPATIISRSQHFVFKRLSDAELEAHLTKILDLEKAPYEEAAIRLIARRASGSVRDSMSLLGQVLALGNDGLKESDVRSVLGLAGQELFFNILHAMQKSDCAGLSATLRQMLDQGVDLGFFLRELSTMWRNLFMLKQAGRDAIPLVDLPDAELERWMSEAASMDLAHIHAAWQLTLEGQRRVLTSLEPALALELLLLNVAMLPRLLSLDQLSILSRKIPAQTPAGNEAAQPTAEKKSPEYRTEPDINEAPDRQAPARAADFSSARPSVKEAQTAGASPSPQARADDHDKPGEPYPPDDGKREFEQRRDATASGQQAAAEPDHPGPEARQSPASDCNGADAPEATRNASPAAQPQADEPADGTGSPGSLGGPGDWDGFMHFLSMSEDISPGLRPLLLRVSALWTGNVLTVTPKDGFTAGRVSQPGVLKSLKELLHAYSGQSPDIEIAKAENAGSDIQVLMEEAKAMPLIKELEKELGAELIDCRPWYK